jgi:hypothetical protein
MCHSTDVHSKATRDYGDSAIIIANAKQLARRSDEEYEPHSVRLHGMKSTTGIGCF